MRYLVEGSVEKSAGRIRVTAQLIDATTGNHLWAERFDRELADIFAIRDDVIAAIVGALSGHTGPLAKAEQRRAMKKSPDKLEARDFYYQAMSNFGQFKKEANAQARALLEKSIELDPSSVETHVMLAWVHWRDGWIGWNEDAEASYERALEVARAALALDASNYRAHWVLGAVLRVRGDSETARAEYERAFQLNRRDPDMLADWGEFLLYDGQPNEAVSKLEEAVALNPHYPDWYLNILSHSYYHTKQYDEAVRAGSRVTNPQKGVLKTLAASFAQLGRTKEAAAVIERLLKIDSGESIAQFRLSYATMDEDLVEHFVDGLRKAGLPE